MIETKERVWTNPSIVGFAQGDDPVQKVARGARALVLEAIDAGWSGPPFDPVWLATFRGLNVRPSEEVRDARTIPSASRNSGDQVGCIEYNPTRSRGRLRYSIAHEIAHTLFPDWEEKIRHRAHHTEIVGDDWELEALCNIAAAEILMPAAAFAVEGLEELSIDRILRLCRRFDVSTEAMLVRVAQLLDSTVAMFVASRRPAEPRYLADYIIGSRSWRGPQLGRGELPQGSAVEACTAIGFTAKGDETWGNDDVHVECVGVPPYPGSPHPRVAGILTSSVVNEVLSMTFVAGDLTQPHGQGARLVAHVVNDRTPNWTQRGIAGAIARRWPVAQSDFQAWAAAEPTNLSLGQIRVCEVEHELWVASIVAQHGYGESRAPRIRYRALSDGLTGLATWAKARRAAVHMGRLGCGQAGGSWDVVEEIVLSVLCDQAVSVTVYDPPQGRRRIPVQEPLPFNRA